MEKNELIEFLINKNRLKTPEIINAFRKIDRKNFVLPELLNYAYEDNALRTKKSQTISQPSTVAFMFELLKPKKNDRILDVGSGSGWTTALLAEIVGEKGKVIGLEIVDELVSFGQENLKKYNFKNAEIKKTNEKFDGIKNEKFDKILVSASATQLPNELIEMLKEGGIMVIPIGNSIWKIEKKSEKEIEKTEFPGFIFVPLIH
jgi:protein-L-isoaspartate(D-aspartate) O-methyltransferase